MEADTVKLSKSEKKKQKKKQKGENGKPIEKPVEENKLEEKEEETKQDKQEVADNKKSKQKPTESKKPKNVEREITGGVKLIDAKLGTGPMAKKGNTVGMRYIGKLQNGKVFDKNVSGKPVSHNLDFRPAGLTSLSSSSTSERVKSSKARLTYAYGIVF